jgi:hypothetical protein
VEGFNRHLGQETPEMERERERGKQGGRQEEGARGTEKETGRDRERERSGTVVAEISGAIGSDTRSQQHKITGRKGS